MQLNTIAGVYNLPCPISATETAVASINAIGGASAGYTQQTTPFGTVRAVVGPPPDISGGELDGRPFKLRVGVSWVATGGSNLTVNAYWNCGANTNLLTFTSDVLVIGSGALAVASANGSMFMEAALLWGSGEKQLVGFWNEIPGIANLPTPAGIKATGALTAASPIAISTTASQAAIATMAGLQFFVTVTVATIASVTSVKLTELAIERY